MGTNSGYLDPLISPTYQDDGDPLIRRANINLIGFTVEEDIVNNAIKVTNTGGGGGGSVIALSDHAAFRALGSAPTDGTVIHFQSPPGTYIFDSTSGAGFADDDNIVLKRTVTSTGAAGRAYNASTAVMPTYAAYRLIGSLGLFTSYQILARSVKDDGGGGVFAYDSSDSTSTDNDATTLVSGSKRVKRVFSGSVHAEWFGVRADGRRVSDGQTYSSTPTKFTSATAAFTSADVGKKILVRTPSGPVTGTVSLGTGNVLVSGVGTAFLTDIPVVPATSIPASGGAVYIDGTGATHYAIIALDNTTLHMRIAPSVTVTGRTLYRETQLATTIAAYVSATEVTLSNGALLSLTGQDAFLATDDTDAVEAALNFGFANNVEVLFPEGLIGVSDNLYFESLTGLVATGQGWALTTFVDLRKASDQTLIADRVVDNYGMLSFKLCTNVTLQKMSWDGSVPAIGMAHSAGGVENNSGGRIAVFFRSCDDCSVLKCGSGTTGYGARDELFYADGGLDSESQRNWRVEGCTVLMSNNNSINAGNVGKGLLVQGNTLRSAYSCLQIVARSAIVAKNILTANGGFTEGGTGPTVIEQIAEDSMLYEGNVHIGSDTHGFGEDMVSVFPGAGATSACTLTMRGNQYVDNTGYFYNSNSAVVRIQNMPGTVNIENETFDRNTAGATGGTFIEIDGASTGKVTIGPCNLRGRAGSNMTRGIVVASDVPDGVVRVLPGTVFGESVTTQIELNGVALADNGTSVTL